MVGASKPKDFPVLSQKGARREPRVTDHENFRDIGFCFICKATSCGLGTSNGQPFKTPKYFCSHCGPKLAKALYNVRDGKLNVVEARATELAGGEMGQYLDSIGETDLAKLTPHQFSTFCRRFISAYINNVRELSQDFIPQD